MKVVILGSGVLGVLTAYELGKRGFSVTVLERNAECATETSFANGGQLSYTHAEPWATPSVLGKLSKWLVHSDSPLVIRPRLDADMIRWGLKFLGNCTTNRANMNSVNLLRLGLYSKDKFDEIRAETGVEFDYNNKGILHIFSTEQEFDHAKKQYEFQAKFGSEHRVLSRDQCLSVEPVLANTPRQIVGGIHAIQDEIGDTYMFCRAIEKIATERYGVTFEYGVSISNINVENSAIRSITTDKGEYTADAHVMALGVASPLFLRKLGINVPIYPMKGYSITVDANEHCPQASITDGSHKIVYTRMGNRLRVAGTAEFAGYNLRINEKRITPMVKAGRELLPHANWDQEIGKWACLRPSTPDGLPILGRTPLSNLHLNTGHGTLGWTQAAGSAALVADSIEGKPPGILVSGLTLKERLAR